jgi:hypothetical protein
MRVAFGSSNPQRLKPTWGGRPFDSLQTRKTRGRDDAGEDPCETIHSKGGSP